MIDSSGALVEDVFDGLGCGAYDFVASSGSTTYKSIAGIVPSNDGGYYIYGAYHGYDDGTTNDTTQRMVSKLYGLSVGVEEDEEVDAFMVYPNPASDQLRLSIPAALLRTGGLLQLYSATGQLVLSTQVSAPEVQLAVKHLSGLYTLVLASTTQRWVQRVQIAQ